MLTFTTGNMFESKTEAITNTVNCVGVMGKGLALEFKKRYPDNFYAYKTACERGEVLPGKMFVYRLKTETNPKFIINFPTKRHWRNMSLIKDIKIGLVDLISVIKNNDIKSITIPPLGCGLGGLNWNDVRDEIKNKLEALYDINIIIESLY